MDLRTSEQKALKHKLSDMIGAKLRYLESKEGGAWANLDVMKIYGLGTNRQSELKGRIKGDYLEKTVSDRDFILCLTGGLMTIAEILKSEILTEKEKLFIVKNYSIHEEKDAGDLYYNLKKEGGDPMQIWRDALAALKK